MERAVNGQHINKAKLSLLKQSGDKKIPYFELDLEHVVVTSFQISAHGGGQLPMESATLHFVKVKSKYLPQGNEGDATGNVDFGDLILMPLQVLRGDAAVRERTRQRFRVILELQGDNGDHTQ